MKTRTQALLSQFKALADPVKIRMVSLCAVAECSVTELTAVTGLSQPRVSQHLKQLCAANLLEHFRDGHFVFYRVPSKGPDAPLRRRLLALLPDDEPQFAVDADRLRSLRVPIDPQPARVDDRPLHRALVELTVARPVGDLLDIGCGRGRLLKLLASRAQRAVGVDIDPDARRFARAEMLLAGLPNCTLRQGDMVALPFADDEFDTIILDGVLAGATEPERGLAEALRLLRSGGRLVLLESIEAADIAGVKERFASLAHDAGLRLTRPRPIPETNPAWLLAVASPADSASAAA